jgi:hypothetical protein
LNKYYSVVKKKDYLCLISVDLSLHTTLCEKFVSNLEQVGGFLPVLWFPPPMKLTATDITEILLKVALNNINRYVSSTGLILLEFESTTSRTRDEHSNHYTNEGVEVNKRLRIPKGQSKMDNP